MSFGINSTYILKSKWEKIKNLIFNSEVVTVTLIYTLLVFFSILTIFYALKDIMCKILCFLKLGLQDTNFLKFLLYFQHSLHFLSRTKYSMTWFFKTAMFYSLICYHNNYLINILWIGISIAYSNCRTKFSLFHLFEVGILCHIRLVSNFKTFKNNL